MHENVSKNRFTVVKSKRNEIHLDEFKRKKRCKSYNFIQLMFTTNKTQPSQD